MDNPKLKIDQEWTQQRNSQKKSQALLILCIFCNSLLHFTNTQTHFASKLDASKKDSGVILGLEK